MTYVFEARELPFGAVTEAYAAPLQPLLTRLALHDLPLWDRCMLVAVLGVMQQRPHHHHSTATTAAPPHTPRQTDGRHPDATTTNTASFPPSAMGAARNDEGGDVATPPCTRRDPADPSVEDVAVALTIVRALDELEVVYDSIRSTRAEWRAQTQGPASASPSAAAAAAARAPPTGTAEEVLLEQLLQERFSDTAPYLPASDDSADEDAAAEVADVAMCFTAAGESLGIGSASVFGGHGYHA